MARPADPAPAPLRLRPPPGPAVAVVVVAGLVLLASGRDRLTVVDLVLVGGPALLLLAVLVLPVLVVTDEHVDVVGVLRRHRVPWPAVERVRQGWFLTLDLTDGRRLVALAAPVVSSMVSFRTLAEDEHHVLTRESAQRAAFPGASASLAVELVTASRPTGPVPAARTGTGDPVPAGRRATEDPVPVGRTDAVRTGRRPVVCAAGLVLVVAWTTALASRLW